MIMNKRIGFMQGRLSNLVDGKIQAFPWDFWKEEFETAKKINISLLEWTLDQDRLYDNPLMTDEGRNEILELKNKYSIEIPSLTGDCFMQSPFWKEKSKEQETLKNDFINICYSASEIGIEFIVVPLVDNGSIENQNQERILVNFLLENQTYFVNKNLKIIFESDLPPKKLNIFINSLPDKVFGINYDIGNSAALDFDPVEEISTYGKRIMNVHVKDRILNGTTVLLGEGNANFNIVFKELNNINYTGNFILQTARDPKNNHARAIEKYHTMVQSWIDIYATH